jgi:hypothetical protein
MIDNRRRFPSYVVVGDVIRMQMGIDDIFNLSVSEPGNGRP